jgi:hypothetical protein
MISIQKKLTFIIQGKFKQSEIKKYNKRLTFSSNSTQVSEATFLTTSSRRKKIQFIPFITNFNLEIIPKNNKISLTIFYNAQRINDLK